MTVREVMAYHPYSHIWKPVVVIDYFGRGEDTVVPIEQHPAIKEDAERRRLDRLLFRPGTRQKYKKGELANMIADWLNRNGPTIASVLADELDVKACDVTRALKRWPGRFKPCGYQQVRCAKATVWGVR